MLKFWENNDNIPETTSADVQSERNSMVSIVLQPTTRVVKSSSSAQGSGRRPSRSRDDLLWRPLYCMNHCMDLVLRVTTPGFWYTVSTLLLKSNFLYGYDLSLTLPSDSVVRMSFVRCNLDLYDLLRLMDLTNPSSRLSPVTLNLPKYGHCLDSGRDAEKITYIWNELKVLSQTASSIYCLVSNNYVVRLTDFLKLSSS
jgi:hypothetical protein